MREITRLSTAFFDTEKCQHRGCPYTWPRSPWNYVWQSTWNILCVTIVMEMNFSFGMWWEVKRRPTIWRPNWNPHPWCGNIHHLCPKDVQNYTSASKVLRTTFWDAQGLLFLDVLEVESTNATRYCHTLLKLKEAIQKSGLAFSHLVFCWWMAMREQTWWRQWSALAIRHTVYISHPVTFSCFRLWRRISVEGALERMLKSHKSFNDSSI